MGVAITEILVKKEIELKDLSNKIIVIDAPLFLYQFLSSIRSADGTPLTDSKGDVTSHLIGLFSRTITLMQNNIKIAYVFDGKSPDLKSKERERRRKLKEEAIKEYEIAKERHDVEMMEKFAKRTSKLTPSMIEDSIELISALGLPAIHAPTEAEAQASYMVKKGDAWAVATQDADTMMFGATRIVKNLSIAGKRKKANKLSFETYKPEVILLSENLTNLGLGNDDFIALCMLVGTDFNVGGIKGIGPKKALDLVKKFPNDHEAIFKEAKWDEHFDYPWEEVFNLIKNMEVSDDYKLSWSKVDEDEIFRILVDKHDFSKERVEHSLARFRKESISQRGLNEFF